MVGIKYHYPIDLLIYRNPDPLAYRFPLAFPDSTGINITEGEMVVSVGIVFCKMAARFTYLVLVSFIYVEARSIP